MVQENKNKDGKCNILNYIMGDECNGAKPGGRSIRFFLIDAI